jgi:hypothetical protein
MVVMIVSPHRRFAEHGNNHAGRRIHSQCVITELEA